MRFCRPPAFVAIAGNARGIQQARAAIGERVVGFAAVADGTLIALGYAVEARTVGIANFFPNPPPIVRPDAKDIAVAIAE